MSEFTVSEIDGQRVVTFAADVSTGEAYDLTQWNDEICDGDVLSVPAEGVVGVMFKAWPTNLESFVGSSYLGLPWWNAQIFCRSESGC